MEYAEQDNLAAKLKAFNYQPLYIYHTEAAQTAFLPSIL